MSTIKGKGSKPSIVLNESIQTLMVDNLWLSARTDDIFFLQFGVTLPDGVREQARLMVPKNALINMLRPLCKLTGFDPSKNKGNGGSNPKS